MLCFVSDKVAMTGPLLTESLPSWCLARAGWACRSAGRAPAPAAGPETWPSAGAGPGPRCRGCYPPGRGTGSPSGRRGTPAWSGSAAAGIQVRVSGDGRDDMEEEMEMEEDQNGGYHYLEGEH